MSESDCPELAGLCDCSFHENLRAAQASGGGLLGQRAPELAVHAPAKGECGCGNFRDPGTDPILFLLTGGVCALVPQAPKNFSGYTRRTDVTLHACAVCWTIYAAPKRRKRRG